MTSPTVDVAFGVGPVLPLFEQYALFVAGVVIVAAVAWHVHRLARTAPRRVDTDAGIAVAAAWTIALVAGCTGAWISVFGAWALGGGVGLVIGVGHLSLASVRRICVTPGLAIVLMVGTVAPHATVADVGAWALVHAIPSLVFGLIAAGFAWLAHERVAHARQRSTIAAPRTAR